MPHRCRVLPRSRPLAPCTPDSPVGWSPGTCAPSVTEPRAAQAPRRGQTRRRPGVRGWGRRAGAAGERGGPCCWGGLRSPPGTAHLQVGELPGAVVLGAAGPGEGRPEVHLDQLPLGAVADVAEDARGEGGNLSPHWPGPATPPSGHQAHTAPGPASDPAPGPGPRGSGRPHPPTCNWASLHNAPERPHNANNDGNSNNTVAAGEGAGPWLRLSAAGRPGQGKVSEQGQTEATLVAGRLGGGRWGDEGERGRGLGSALAPSEQRRPGRPRHSPGGSQPGPPRALT